MSTAATQPTDNSAEKGLSQGARVLNTFADPVKAFTDIRRSASWWLPFVLIAIFSYALIFAAAQKIGFEQISQNQIRMNAKRAEQMENMPADQRANAERMSVTITKGISYAIPVFFLIIALISAAILMATFNFGLGAEIKFGQAMAVFIYGSMVGIVKAVLVIISIYAGASPEGFNFQNPLASNLGALVDVTQHPALFTAASAVGIFVIWKIILMGIGFSCISKVKRGTAIAVVAGWYVLFTLISVGLAAAFA